MKIVSNKEYEKIGTVAIYKERLFYPRNPEITSLFDETFRESSKPASLMIPSNLQTDLSEFSLYDFEFDTSSHKDYPTVFLPDYLDNSTIAEIEGDDFDKLAGSMLPQNYITNQSENSTTFTYFGKLENDSKKIDLIKVPSGMWKVEVYNESYLSSNYILNGVPGFLDYDLLRTLSRNPSLSLTITASPFLVIYFGPVFETKIEGHSFRDLFPISTSEDPNPKSSFEFYTSRYYTEGGDPMSAEEYIEFPYSLTPEKYIYEYSNEVSGEKVLYLVSNPIGTLESVDLVIPSYFAINNPHRNQNKISLRNDDSSVNPVPVDQVYNFLVDKVSGVYLGKSVSPESSIIQNRLVRITDRFYTGRVQEMRKIIANGKEMEKGNSGKYVLNPEISPLWSIPGTESKTLYNKVFVSSSSNGNTVPTGIVYCKANKNLELTTTPDIGYYGTLNSSQSSYHSGVLEVPVQNLDSVSIEFFKLDFELLAKFIHPDSTISLKDLGQGVVKINGETYTEGVVTLQIDSPLRLEFDWSKSSYIPKSIENFLKYFNDPTQPVEYADGSYVVELTKDRVRSLGESTILEINGDIDSRVIMVDILPEAGIQCNPGEYAKVNYGESLTIKFYNTSGKRMDVYVDTESSPRMTTEGFSGEYTLENISNSHIVVIRYHED